MGVFRQPDRRSCGAAVLVMARMLAEPEYDRWVRAATDRGARFAEEALDTHRRTNRIVGRGRLQLPWPRALGTQPWALARDLAGPHRVRLVIGRARAFARVLRTDRPVAMYVGNRLLPRHVVLVTGRTPDGDTLRVYEPSSGDTVRVSRQAFLAGKLDLAGWDRPWFVVLPG